MLNPLCGVPKAYDMICREKHPGGYQNYRKRDGIGWTAATKLQH